MSDPKKVLDQIKDNDVKFVDLRFTDPHGKWQHLAIDVGMVDEDFFVDGVMFDGSSIAGWKAIHESDMTLIPDPSTAVLDPFAGSGTTLIACEKAGRQARLIELDPGYVDVIIRRWRDWTGKAATLESDGRRFEENAAGHEAAAA